MTIVNTGTAGFSIEILDLLDPTKAVIRTLCALWVLYITAHRLHDVPPSASASAYHWFLQWKRVSLRLHAAGLILSLFVRCAPQFRLNLLNHPPGSLIVGERVDGVVVMMVGENGGDARVGGRHASARGGGGGGDR